MEDLHWTIVIRAAFLVLCGIMFLRISGRKSISQMTVATTIIMISIGSMLAQGLVEKTVWRSAAGVASFLLFLVVVEYMEMKFAFLEKIISGTSMVVVQNGQVDEKKLKKLRLTKDQLEMRLRQKGIERLSDVQIATMEINGELGYQLKREAKPLTVGQFEAWIQTLNPNAAIPQPSAQASGNLFEEVRSSESNRSSQLLN
ncbi:DUF421 domain-containing protein [Paenibacillus hexagrammi]|uniref:DUF421 domain-containing protein n=1 Tax=Paenibacillus hexagrammi TaxID=2908839 RepID=A0ABY3SKB6_9BACL|nr:YetF domain-containing protein [Paenibacillus sp. YPD9-1]UJF34144.1 DUF421 domain-containing protein [Paenibacillus sp. YPD9-1]